MLQGQFDRSGQPLSIRPEFFLDRAETVKVKRVKIAMLCLGHYVVAYKIYQELHALRLSPELICHLLKLILAISCYNSPLFKNPMSKTSLKVTLGQSSQIPRKAHLLVLLDHQPQIKGFDVHGDHLGDIVCSLLQLCVEPFDASQSAERFRQQYLLMLVDRFDKAI